ncbi:hypothetical protein [Spirosoma sp. KNUC1025]|uniref:hypothetical protein n=1 Tax=Spirosoma sp. KNUC1025 TaxID=2894082 RepID=UPI00386CF28F|nr:hypothetical protein LN737_22700 [Spirosoma sp. KNUC1025]
MKTFKHLLTTAFVAFSAATFAQSTVTVTTSADSTTTTSTVTHSTRIVHRVTSGLKFYVGFNSLGDRFQQAMTFDPLAPDSLP